jgi:hypothetical protein
MDKPSPIMWFITIRAVTVLVQMQTTSRSWDCGRTCQSVSLNDEEDGLAMRIPKVVMNILYSEQYRIAQEF